MFSSKQLEIMQRPFLNFIWPIPKKFKNKAFEKYNKGAIFFNF